MSDYIKATDFALKDTLPSGDSGKIVKGTEIDDEFNAIEATVVTKADRDGTNLLDGAVATAKIADNAITTAKLATGIAPVVSSINGGQLAGMRNKIINGKMEIAQRGTSFAAAGSGVYTLDRWVPSSSTAGVVTISQQADVPADNEFQSSLRVAVTTADASIAASDNFGVFQNIEGFNVRDLIGRTFTLSFWVRSSKTGTHCVSLRNGAGDRTYVAEYTVSAANTWEKKSITVSSGLITAGTWNWTNGLGLSVGFNLYCGSTFQTTAGSWQTGNFLATANQVNCLDTIGNIFAITGVQLEVGSVATPFEHRPYGAELALCQRYYYRNTAGVAGAPLLGVGAFATINSANLQFNYPVPLRSAPSVIDYGNVYIGDGTVGAAVTSLGASFYGPNGSQVNMVSSASFTAGRGAYVYAGVSAAAYVAFSAEF